MAVAYKALLSSGLGTTSSTTVVITTTAAIAIGDFIVVRVAADNLTASTPTITSVVDGGNTYTQRLFGGINATAAAGVVGAIFTSLATVARPTSSTITITFSGAIAHKASFAQSFTGVDNTVRSVTTAATGTATALSAGASGTVNAGDLVLGFAAIESNAAVTADSDTLNGPWSSSITITSAAGGTATARVAVHGQYKIATASGAQTFDMTVPATEWVAGCLVMQATVAGTAAVTYVETLTASGKRAPRGTATVAYTESVGATGDAPTVIASQGTAAVTWSAQLGGAAGPSYVSEVLTDAPAGYWRLGETAGPNAVDSSGNGFGGSYVGAPTLGVPSLLNSDANTAMQVLGATHAAMEGVNCGNPAAFQLSGNFTLEAWVQTPSSGGSYRSVFVKQFAYGIFLLDGVVTSYEWSSGTSAGSGVNVADGLRHHLVVAYGGNLEADASRFYVDGVVVGNAFTRAVQGQGSDLEIGYNTGGGVPQAINAVIDEVAVYPTKLSAGRVAAHYAAGNRAPSSGGATGTRTPKATAAVGWSTTLTAAGTAPVVVVGGGGGTRTLESGVARLTEAGDRRLLEAGEPVPTGTAATTYTAATTAVGKRTPKSASTTAHAWTTAAQGVKPVVGVKQGTAAVTYTEMPTTATGKKTPKSTATTTYTTAVTNAQGVKPVVGMKQGTAAAAWTSAVTAAGKRSPKATSTPVHTWATLAQGVRPLVGVKQGTAIVSHIWSPTAVGKKTAKSTAVVAHIWATTATGKRIQQGTAASSYVEALTAAGKKIPRSTLTTAYVVTALAAGKRAPKGASTPTSIWTSTAAGKKLQLASATVAYRWVPTANGKKLARSVVLVTYVEGTSATGKYVPAAQSSLSYLFSMEAFGFAGITGSVEGLWNGLEVVAMQYGDKGVIDWLLIPA